MSFLRTPARKIAVLIGLPGPERALMLEAMTWLAMARIWLLVAPFHKIAAKLGEARQPSELSLGPDPRLSPADESMAKGISMAIERASKNVPIRAVCIQQAIAAKLMLRRRGIPSVMHFGVAKGNFSGERMRAHAWLNVTHIKVTGYPVTADMHEIACFI